MIVGFLAVIGLLFWYEDIRIRRYSGDGRARLVFVVAMMFATGVAIAVSLNIPLPTPTKFIHEWLGGIGRWIIPDRA